MRGKLTQKPLCSQIVKQCTCKGYFLLEKEEEEEEKEKKTEDYTAVTQVIFFCPIKLTILDMNTNMHLFVQAKQATDVGKLFLFYCRYTYDCYVTAVSSNECSC